MFLDGFNFFIHQGFDGQRVFIPKGDNAQIIAQECDRVVIVVKGRELFQQF